MIILRKTFSFEASHQLKFHDGKCANLHGHSWKLTIEVRGGQLEDVGEKSNMLLDYGDISNAVKPFIEKLDHKHLNDVFNTDSPTSEFISITLFNELQQTIPLLFAIEISETENTLCRYEGK